MAEEIYPNEWLIGKQFSRDGSDYDPNAKPPRWADVLDVIEEEEMHTLTFLALGIFYYAPWKAANGKEIPGEIKAVPVVKEWVDIVNVALEREQYSMADDQVETIDSVITYHVLDLVDRSNTPYYVRDVCGLQSDPVHIFGIILRKNS
jgi:hypothetical protein